MAFPSVVSTAVTNLTAAAATQTVNLPASIVSGNLLVIFITTSGGSTAPTLSATGWTSLGTDNDPNLVVYQCALYRVADGTEGSTVTVSISPSLSLCADAYQFSGASGNIEKGTAAQATTGNANPPSLSPSWGAKDTLWIAHMGLNSGSGSITAAPTNYSNLLTALTTASHAVRSLGTAQRTLNASSEDPGTFTNTSANWNAQTYAIEPAAAIAFVGKPLRPYLRR